MSFAVIYEDRLKCYNINKDNKDFIDSLKHDFRHQPCSGLNQFYSSEISSESFNNQLILNIHNFLNEKTDVDFNQNNSFNNDSSKIDFKYISIFKLILFQCLKSIKYIGYILELIIINIISIIIRKYVISLMLIIV